MRPIIVIDFGGQYAHLIANRVRKLGVYSEIFLPETPLARIKERNPAGVILSGGGGDLKADKGLLDLGVPICYGFQWLAHVSGGQVHPGAVKEYGRTVIDLCNGGGVIFKSESNALKRTVWMSHGDEVAKLPDGFVQTARSLACNNVAAENAQRKIFGLQFHPEVVHTEGGTEMLRNFVSLCADASLWSTKTFSQRIQDDVKAHIGNRNVFILVSGGVDSTVAYTLLQKVLDPSRVYGLLVDTGFMRYKEVEIIQKALQAIGFKQLHVEDASETFFNALKGVYDPEKKRGIIGQAFLDVKDRVARELKLDSDQWLLGQGTIYPDTIETGGTKHAAKIKTHHNRVDAITKLMAEGRVVEPLRDLYKDEVRALGQQLGLPAELVMRHPFPGPGLAVRILCAEHADYPPESRGIAAEVAEFLTKGGGDARSYRHAIALYFHDSPFLAPHPDQLGLIWDLVPAIANRWAAINRVLVCLSHNVAPTHEFVFKNQSQLTRERAALCSAADHQVQTIVQEDGLYESIWQFPVALLPFGHKAGSESVVLRPVDSLEAMTATAHHLPAVSLKRMQKAILNIAGIDTLFYDLTSKPPGTIEWE